MVLKTKDFQKSCKTILYAIDSKDSTVVTETLELVTDGDTLNMNVTNRDYYVTTKFKLDEPIQFKAAVNAKLFLNLMSKLTTESIDITVVGNTVKIKADGDYKLPIVQAPNGSMLVLPVITIGNVTGNMDINSDILHSIALYNSKELSRGTPVTAAQCYYYVDERGAITYTTGACVNTFTLEKPIKMLLSDKVVKLFRLFNENEKVAFSIGQDALTDELYQTKVSFNTPTVSIVAKLPDTGLVSGVPVAAIRGMAEKEHTYSVVVNKTALANAIQRILLMCTVTYAGTFTFDNEKMTIADNAKDNVEYIKLENECNGLTSFSVELNINTFKNVLDGVDDDYLTICFGDQKDIVVKKTNVSDIILVKKV